MKYSLIVFLLFILCILSCHQNKSDLEGKDYLEINIDAVLDKDTIKYSELFDSFKIISLEASEECLLETIDKVKLVNDTIYIFDKARLKSVFLFSLEGKYLGKISKIGKGPGEYMSPTDFVVDSRNNSIKIFDWSGQKLLSYDMNGNFLEEINIGNYYTRFISTHDGYYFFVPSPIKRSDSTIFLLNKYKNNGRKLSSMFNSDNYCFGSRSHMNTPRDNFFQSSDGIKFYMLFSDTIYKIQGNNVFPHIVLKTDRYKMTRDEIISIESGKENESFYELSKLDKLFNIYDYCEFNDKYFFKFNIGTKLYFTLFDSKNKDIQCAGRMENDMTSIYVDIFMVNNNHFAGIIYPRIFSIIKKDISKKANQLTPTDKDLILGLSSSDNPVIVIYNVKEN